MPHENEEFAPIREFYDNEYYAGSPRQGRLPWHCRRVAARLGSLRGKNVLDVACGTGEWLRHFRERGALVAGIDLSEKAIEVCRAALPGGEFHCGPAESLPFPDARFDVVTCMGSLEHFLDKPAALAEMKRVAAPGATIVLLVPNAGFLTRRLGLYRGTQQQKAREDVLSLAAWRLMFRSAGLSVTARWRDLHPLTPGWIARGSVWGWPIRAVQALALTIWPVAWQYQVYHCCRVADASRT